MKAAKSQGGVRKWLNGQTDALHQALHHHPAFGQLIEPTLRPSDYRAILEHIYAIFADVEAQRTQYAEWDAFRLSPWLAALRADLGTPVSPKPGSWLRSSSACLGALYVLHGSAFGGRVIGAKLAQHHPNLPRCYYAQQADPAVWRSLVAALERVQDSGKQADLLDGANQTFTRFGAFELTSDITEAA